MESRSNSFLETEKVSRLMGKYAIPCVISLVVGALYNIVDQIFIANASYLGSYGNAANTVVFPLTVLALGIAVMIGDGCCAFVSIALGSGRKEDANRAVGNSVVLCVVGSLVLMALYLILRDPILALFGGTVNPQTEALSKEYFFWITLGIPFYMFGQAMNPIIRSDGSPKFAMAATLSGAVANILLDPLFIYGFRWGMMGAAVATVIGQILTAAMSMWYLLHMKAMKVDRESLLLSGRVIRKFLALGMTSFLAQVSLVVSMAAVQNTCMMYGALDPIFSQQAYAQIPLAVLGIVMKFFQIAISVSIGLAAGCIPIAGYNIGAKRKDRVRTLFTYLLAAEAIVGGIALVIVECFPPADRRAVRRRQRKRLLCGICREVLPNLPVHDDSGNGEQGHLHLPAGTGQSGGLHRGIPDPGDPVWRISAHSDADIPGAGRAAVVVPGGRSADLRHCPVLHPANLPGAAIIQRSLS